MVGHNKKAIFSYLTDCVWKKCQDWNARSLSRAGKEVLIKSVVQAFPSYCMEAFLIPNSLCQELERRMNSFYLGLKKNGSRDINWMKWDKFTLHKSRDGLGFRNMEAFNLSMFGKQSLKLLTDSNSLLTRVLKAKYLPRRDFLDAPLVIIQATQEVSEVFNHYLQWAIDGKLEIVQHKCVNCTLDM